MIKNLDKMDLSDIKDVYFNSFSLDEAPSTYKLISEIIEGTNRDDSLVFGYKMSGIIVAGIAFTPIFIDENPRPSAYILAPLAVHRDHHRKGIASELIGYGKKILIERGVDFLLVYGDPNFYSKFGFSVDIGKAFVPPYKLEYDYGWQALNLTDFKIGASKYHFKCVEPLSNQSLW
jgi:putative acetyltransferase